MSKRPRSRAAATPPSARPLPEANGAAMDFEITEIVIPVNIKDKDGKVCEYLLREANGDASCRWRNAIFQRTKLGKDGKPESMSAMADTEPILVSLCLFETGTGKSVSVNTIRSWPSRIQKQLFERAKDISDLDDEEDEANLETLIEQRDQLSERIRAIQEEETAAKNVLVDTTVGS